MRQVRSLKLAAICGAVGLMAFAGKSFGQIVTNPSFSLPNDGATGTDTTAEIDGTNSNPATSGGWYMSSAPNNDGVGSGPPNYIQPGSRCQFDPTLTPAGSSWGFWEQTFCQDGTAQEVISGGITPGNTYLMTAQMAFQDGTGPGQGTNAVTAANQSAGTPNNGENGGNGYSYLGIIWLDRFGNPIGTLDTDGLSAETMIPAGSVTTYAPLSPPATSNNGGFNAWAPYSVGGLAPNGAAGVELVLGWANGGMDGSTGGQAAVASDVSLVPEPASLSLLGLGGLAILRRRR